MKKIIALFSLFLIGLIAGCTPASEQIMQPLQYNKTIGTHLPENAQLIWKRGTQDASEAPDTVAAGNQGLLAALITVSIDSAIRNSHPGAFTFSYGKAQEAVFLTSLRDVLKDQKVFKSIEIPEDISDVSKSNTLITIYFKSTRVSDAVHAYQITLDVQVTLQSPHRNTYQTTYLLQSNPSQHPSFKDQQADVSEQLLEKVIHAITQWSHSSRGVQHA